MTQTLWPVIRVEPPPDADNEKWTELDPHIPSPPEIQTTLKSGVARVQEVIMLFALFNIDNLHMY